jgi:hypothetical protein
MAGDILSEPASTIKTDRTRVDPLIHRPAGSPEIATTFLAEGSSGKKATQTELAARLAAELGQVGCFVTGTPCWVATAVPATISSVAAIDLSASAFDPIETKKTVVVNETVAIGQRIPTRNPTKRDRDSTYSDLSYFGWKAVAIEVRHANGSLVDVELLRSPEWMEKNGVRAGASVDLRVTDIALEATAYVVSVEDDVLIEPGEGAVVTGRFATREGNHPVRLTLEDDTELVRTSGHPVWSPLDQEWRGLGDFEPGSLLQTRAGSVAVASTERCAGRPPVYNIEVDEEHVYEVAGLGVLVHNGTGFDCDRFSELLMKVNQKGKGLAGLSEAEAEEFAKLRTELAEIGNATNPATKAAAASEAAPGKLLKPGDAGRFGDLTPGQVGDKLTPHHMPQRALEFTGEADEAALVMEEELHALTRTFKGKGIAAKAQDIGKSLTEVLKQDILHVRNIAKNAGNEAKYDEGLRKVINYYIDNSYKGKTPQQVEELKALLNLLGK